MTAKNVRDLLPGMLVVPRFQSPQAHNSDTDPRAVNSVSIYSDGVTVTYKDDPSADTYTYDDEVEVAAPLPTEPLRLRWRASQQKWVLNLVSADMTKMPAVVVEVNGRTAFDGTPKPLPTSVNLPADGEPPADVAVNES